MTTADWRVNFVLQGGLILMCALCAGCATGAGMNNLVAVRAQADAAYVARGAASPTPQRYVFMRGRYFPSMFDREVKQVEFPQLTKIVAADLLPRFTPVANASEADLVIVIHWGAVPRIETAIDDLFYDPDALRQASEGIETARQQAAADFKAGNYAAYGQVAQTQANLRNEMQIADSVYSTDSRANANAADLIGLRGLYSQHDTTAQGDALRSLLEDDRYLVTLIAYDAQGLRLKQKWPVWTARMSVPVAGRDFATAVRQMSAVAAPYYGTQHADMVLQHPAMTP